METKTECVDCGRDSDPRTTPRCVECDATKPDAPICGCRLMDCGQCMTTPGPLTRPHYLQV